MSFGETKNIRSADDDLKAWLRSKTLNMVQDHATMKEANDYIKSLELALTQSQDTVDRWINTSSAQHQEIYELNLALTQSRAETAAAYERAEEIASDRANAARLVGWPAEERKYASLAVSIRALATPEQSAALDAVIAEKLKENTKGIAEPCPCTLIEQDESCPVGYPSLLCSICQGTGNTTPDKITALACEMLKIASDLGETEDPFAAWEVIASMQEEAQLCEAIKAEARSQGMREAAEICEEQSKTFLSTEYATNQPVGSFSERFACRECREAILAAIQKGEPK